VKPRVLALGAGFGGLELATILSERLGNGVDVTVIDKGDAFVFGYAKLDVMFGRKTLDAVRLPYGDFAKPGVRLLRETITSIDPEQRRVTTDAGVHEADYLVVALGADYDYDATPGLADANESCVTKKLGGGATLGMQAERPIRRNAGSRRMSRDSMLTRSLRIDSHSLRACFGTDPPAAGEPARRGVPHAARGDARESPARPRRQSKRAIR